MLVCSSTSDIRTLLIKTLMQDKNQDTTNVYVHVYSISYGSPYVYMCVYQQSLHYWELRYLLLPKQCPTLPPLCTNHEQRRREDELLISNFVRFLEFLNRIKRGLGSAKSFSQSSMQTLVSTLVYTNIHSNHDSLHFYCPKYYACVFLNL